MNNRSIRPLTTCALLLLLCQLAFATDRYVSIEGGHVPPFTSWADAATNIQDAIDASVAGDTVWVTNGVYSTGGKVMAGNLTNRVALDKALTVQSVSGPEETIIEGAWHPGTTNGATAVRCAWLTNDAVLSGFTLRGGATLTSGDALLLQSGGGAWCFSTSSLLSNCVVIGNSASQNGGGIYSGSLSFCKILDNTSDNGGGIASTTTNGIVARNCVISGNTARRSGGGVYSSSPAMGLVQNCYITRNIAVLNTAGGVWGATLINSTILKNELSLGGVGASSLFSGGIVNCVATNCIVLDNISWSRPDNPNHAFSSFVFSCTAPAPPGEGNFFADPEFLEDSPHLSEASPCRVAGITVSGALDIDGQTWGNPPSVGCDEWGLEPQIIAEPAFVPGATASESAMRIMVTGASPLTCYWTKDGTPVEEGLEFGTVTTPQLRLTGFGPSASGTYQVTVSNAYGITTSSVATVTVRCVDLGSENPAAPYLDWSTAATNIQDAVDSAQPGDIVLVTNGVYETGGRQVYYNGNPIAFTNRVEIDKAITVMSMNGLNETHIHGGIGPPVRVVALSSGATLNGFTVKFGSTFGGGIGALGAGGGVYCSSPEAEVVHCLITTNRAILAGGGVYGGTVRQSVIVSNSAASGGGVAGGFMRRSVIESNYATFGGGGIGVIAEDCSIINNSSTRGGGVYDSRVDFSTISGNSSTFGGGAHSGRLHGCTVSNNFAIVEGGGVHSAALLRCKIIDNHANGYGGGVFVTSSLPNRNVSGCLISGNSVLSSGGGVHAESGYLYNCTIIANSAASQAGGVYRGTLKSCILYKNISPSYPDSYNSASENCLVGVDPRLADDFHLSNDSPARGAGSTNYSGGIGLDGVPFQSPPSIGCAEWQQRPIVGEPKPFPSVTTASLILRPGFGGEEPTTFFWQKDGTILSDDAEHSMTDSLGLVVHDFEPSDGIGYQIVASNAFGVSTSAVSQIQVHCVDLDNDSPAAPYYDWASAATNIQDAIDAAAAGSVVLVTNGIYSHGGRTTEDGSLTNRVVLDKPLLLTSVNGPESTVIVGLKDREIAFGKSVRCVWLGDGATISGFTLRGGSTRAVGGASSEGNGGGVYCDSVGAFVNNCYITENSAYWRGGGAYSGTLVGCRVNGNTVGSQFASWGWGGGVYVGVVSNCLIYGNQAYQGGGVSALPQVVSTNLLMRPIVYNSWINGNVARSVGDGAYSVQAGLVMGGRGGASPVYDPGLVLVNCTVPGDEVSTCIFLNSIVTGPHLGSGFLHCCGPQLPSGLGNINADPLLMDDKFHLSEDSPCRGAGTNIYAFGVDIDGQPWQGTPSIGCDEWYSEPVITPAPKARAARPGQIAIAGFAAGQEPFTYQWLRNGELLSAEDVIDGTIDSTVLIAAGSPSLAGEYQLVASNLVGVTTSEVARVVLHYVNEAASSPAAPHQDWISAATNIQDAIDAAFDGGFVVVSNGHYNTGGSVMAGDLTNRIAIDKPITLMSLNGPTVTTVEGAWDPVTTNGPLAIRTAWLGEGASLVGFRLTRGATRTNGVVTALQSGGGVWCAADSAIVTECLIEDNSAARYGGGSCRGTIHDTLVIGNSAYEGGGVAGGVLNGSIVRSNAAFFGGGALGSAYGFPLSVKNSWITGNFAYSSGGGAFGAGTLINCTITANSALISSGGSAAFLHTNCIVVFNSAPSRPNHSGQMRYSCTYPLPPGTGNIDTNPMLVDGYHLAAGSPCIGVGDPAYSSGTDLDGEPWLSPPSMGCDEFYAAGITGALAVALSSGYPEVAEHGAMPLTGEITGRASSLEWDFGDGVTSSNLSYFTSHIWTNAGDYPVTFTAYNSDNPTGVSTNLMVHVVPLELPQLSGGSFTNTSFSVEFSGQPGVSYDIERATNLIPPVVWQRLTTRLSDGSVIQYTDTKATNAMQFYRATVQ